MPKMIQYHGAMTGLGSMPSLGLGRLNISVMVSNGSTSLLLRTCVGGCSPSDGSESSTS